MGRKKLLGAAVSLFFSVCAASAAAISFQIIQHDSIQDEIRSASYVVENSLFDYFFNRGYIATNSPTAITSSSAEDKTVIYAALSEASEGLCDYFISVAVDFSENSTNPAALILSNIKQVSWNVYDVKKGELLASGKKEPKLTQSNNNERGLKNFMSNVAVEIESSIAKKGNAKGW